LSKASPSYNIFHFAGGLTSKGAFPESRSVRYPTPGTLNPEVTLWLLDLSNLTDVKKYWIKEPISLEGQYVLFSISLTPHSCSTRNYCLCAISRVFIIANSQYDQERKVTHFVFICRDSYLISASFITSQATQAVSIVWMSRPQNFTVVSTCFPPNWSCFEVISEA
jgi:Dipeptidyl peptidase IV (DPP IV) N-terminal region